MDNADKGTDGVSDGWRGDRGRGLVWPIGWPRDTLRSLDDSIKEEAAEVIGRRLLESVDGADIWDPVTWERLAVARGCRVEHYCDTHGQPGHYTPPRRDEGGNVAAFAINAALSPDVIVSAWVHEFAHHELYHWLPPQLRGGADLLSYAGNVEDEQEDICRRVEALLLGEGTCVSE